MTDDEFMEKARALSNELNLHIGFSNSRSEHLMDTAVDVIALTIRSAVQEAVEREREACAQIALDKRDVRRAVKISKRAWGEAGDREELWGEITATHIAAAIRSRGQP